MSQFLTRKDIEEAVAFIKGKTGHQPKVGLTLGSGLNLLAEEVVAADIIPFGQVPGFPVSSVEGHKGQLVIGELAGKVVMVMQGRVHYYEGYPMQQITLPIRVMRALGVDTLIVTNAAGGLNPSFGVGDLMLITDHINLVGMAGLNPLCGPNDPTLGPRFLDMTQAYDPELRRIAHQVAEEMGFTLREGVYFMSAGPTFETPADIRLIRMIGADAVGMSTVPEVIVARHGGMRVLGISGISNVIVGGNHGGPGPSHEEVLEAGKAMMPRLIALIKGILARI